MKLFLPGLLIGALICFFIMRGCGGKVTPIDTHAIDPEIKFKATGYDTVQGNMHIWNNGSHEYMTVFLVAEDGEIVQYLDYWGRPFLVSKHDTMRIWASGNPEKPHRVIYLRLPLSPYYDGGSSVANIWYRLSIGCEPGLWRLSDSSHVPVLLDNKN